MMVSYNSRLTVYSDDTRFLSTLTQRSFCFSVITSAIRELDTANGFMHTLTAGPWLFTLPRQWKDWCGIIRW